MKKGLGAAAVLLLVAIAGFLYASPYLTLRSIGRAIDQRDAEAVYEYVDFPALRESVKAQALAHLQTEMDKPELKDNPFASFGQLMAVGIVNKLAETLVSPAGVMLMLKNGKPGKLGDVAAAGAGVDTQAATPRKDYAVDYQSWSKVLVHPKGDTSTGFIFRRDGLWNWKLTAVKLD